MRMEALGRGHCRYVPALLDSWGSARNLRACFQLNSLGKASHVGPGANSVGLGGVEKGIRQAYPQLSFHRLSQMVMKL